MNKLLHSLNQTQKEADRLRRVYDYPRAIALYSQGLDHLEAEQPAKIKRSVEKRLLAVKYVLLEGRVRSFKRLGAADNTLHDLRQMLKVAENLNEPVWIGETLTRQVRELYIAGRFGAAKRAAGRNLRLAKENGSTYLLGLAHSAKAFIEYYVGDNAKAEDHSQKAEKFLKDHAPVEELVNCLVIRSFIEGGLGHSEKELESAQAALELALEINYREGEAYALRKLAISTRDNAVRRDLNEDALIIYEAIGDVYGQSIMYNNSGLNYARLGLYATARRHLMLAVEIQRQIDFQAGLIFTLESLGSVYVDLREYDSALETLREGLEISKVIGNQMIEAACERQLGRLAFGLGNYGEALRHFRRSAKVNKDINHPGLVLYDQALIGKTHLSLKDLKAADRWTKRAAVGLAALNDRVPEFAPQEVYWMRYEVLRVVAPHPPTPSPTKGGRGADAPTLPWWERGQGGEGDNPDQWDVPTSLKKKMTAVAREFRKDPTPSEALLWKALRGKKVDGRKFRRQQPIGPFVVDFYCSTERLIVEVDGPVHQDQKKADQERQQLLESLGLNMVRITAESVESDLAAVLERIQSAFSSLVGEGEWGQGDEAFQTLTKARQLTLDGIASLSDAGLRRNYLNKVDVNRRILMEWAAEAKARRKRNVFDIDNPADLQAGLNRLLKIGVRMNETRSTNDLVDFVMEQLVELTGAERAILVLSDEEGNRQIAGSRGFDENANPLRTAKSTLDEVTRAERASLKEQRVRARNGNAYRAALGKLSRMGAPLISGGRLVGMIYVDVHQLFGSFTHSDLDLLAAFSNQVASALENAGLYEGLEQRVAERTADLKVSNDALEQRAAELAVINSVQEGLATELEFQAILDLVGDRVKEIFNADTTFIALYDRERNIVSWPYYNEGDHRHSINSRPYLGKGLTDRAIQSGEAVRFDSQQVVGEDEIQEVISPNSEEDLNQSGVAVPLATKNHTVGVLSVQSHQKNAYSKDDMRLLSTLASSMSVALENARLFDETNRRASELAVINAVQEGLASKLNADGIYALVGETIRDLFDVEAVNIVTFDRESDLMHVPFSMEKGEYLQDIIEPQSPYGVRKHIFETGETVVVNTDMEGFSEKYDNPVIWGEDPKSALFVPLKSGGEINGVISLQDFSREDAFSESNVRLIETLASSMSVALENAHLFDETTRLLDETQKRNAELAILNNVGQAVSKKLEFKAIVDLVGDKVRETFEVETVAIAFIDQERDWIDVAYYVDNGVNMELDPQPLPRPSLSAWILENRRPVRLGDMEEQQQYGVWSIPSEPGDEEDRNLSYLGVPIYRGEEVTGNISIQSYEEHAFSENDERMLSTLASSMSVALENARLFDETNARAAELALINDVQKSMASQLDYQAIIDLVGGKVGGIFNADTSQIVFIDKASGFAEFPYYVDRGHRVEIPPGPLSRGLNSRIIDSGDPILLGASEEGEKLGSIRIPSTDDSEKDLNESFLGVPITRGSEIIGTINVQSYRKHAYDEGDLRLLSTLASSMGVALENARLFDEVQQSNQELSESLEEKTATNKILREIASSIEDIQPVMDSVAENAARLCKATDASLFLKQDQALQQVAHFGSIETLPDNQVFSLDPGVATGRAVITGEPVHVRDIVEEGAEYPISFELHEEFNWRTILSVPLLREQEPIGAISIRRVDADPFTDNQVSLLQGFANQAVIAIENARLFNETNQRAAELSVINTVQAGLASKLEAQAIFDLVGDRIRDIFDAQALVIMTYDPEREVSHFRYIFEKGERFAVGEEAFSDLTRHLIQTKEPVVINEEAEAWRTKFGMSVPAGEPMKSGVWVPLIVGGEVTGEISLQNIDRENAFGESDVNLLMTLASSMSVALENARLFDETSARAAELEVINSVQTALAAELSIQGIYDVVGEKIRKIFNQADVGIRIFDEDNGMTYFPFAYENGVRLDIEPVPLGGYQVTPVAAEILRTQKTLVINDMAEFQEKFPLVEAVPGTELEKSGVFVPLIVGRKVRGIISLLDMEREFAFNESHVRLLKTLASSMSVALENARLFDETNQRAAELAVINKVQQGLAAELDEQALIDLVGDTIRDIFDAQAVTINRFDVENERSEYLYLIEKGERLYPEEVLPLNQGHKEMIAKGEPLFINTGMAEYLEKVGAKIIVGEEPKSMIAVPLYTGKKVTGRVSLQNIDRENAFTDSDLRLLSTLGSSLSVSLENARLFDETTRLLEETRQRNAELTIINTIGEALSSKLEEAAIVELVGDQIRDIFDAQVVSIHRFDLENQLNEYLYTYEKGKRFYLEPQPIQGSWHELVENKKTVLKNSGVPEYLESFGHKIPAGEVPLSFLVVPMLRGGEIVGAIDLQNVDHENAFTESDVRLLETLASSMSVALENARLFQETNERAAELAVINSVQGGLAAKLETQAIYDLVGDKIQEIFDAQVVLITSYDPVSDRQSYPYMIEEGERLEPPEAQTPWGLSSYITETAKSVLINEDFNTRFVELTGEEHKPLAGENVKAWMGVPLLVGGEVKGTISLQNIDRENAFDDADLRLLTTLASSMSVALENARLFDETNRLLEETEERAAELEVINSVQEGLAAKLEMQAIYDLLGDKIQEVFDAQAVMVVITEGDLHYYPYLIERGVRLEQEPSKVSEHKGFGPQAMVTRQPLMINENLAEKAAELGSTIVGQGGEMTKSAIYVPMMSGDEARGFISIQNVDRENAFDQSDLSLLTTLVNSMSVALENARLFDETNRLLEETEQRAAELAVINSIQEGLASKLDPQGMYDLVGDTVREIFSAQAVMMISHDLKSGIATIEYMFEKGERFYEDPIPFTPFMKYINEHQETIVINEDFANGKKKYGIKRVAGQKTKSGVWVPLLVGKEVRGVITLQNVDQENAFSESDIRLLNTLASSLSVALENARLFDETNRLLEETEQRAAELAVINSVQEGLASQLEPEAMYELVGETIRKIFDAQGVIIGSNDPENEIANFEYMYEKGERFYPDSAPYTPFMRHLNELKETVVINQDFAKQAKKLGMRTVAGQMAKSAVWVPMLVGKDVRGVISLQNVDQENAFSESDVRLLNTLASSLSVALENARLFDETNRLLEETEQRAAELAVINSVQQGLASKLEPQAMYELVGDTIREIFDAQSVMFGTYDLKADIHQFDYVFEKGERFYPEPGPVTPFMKYMSEYRQTVVINSDIDYKALEVGLTQVVGDEAPKSGVWVPLMVGNDVRGIITLQNVDRENAFSDADVRLLTTLASSLSVALENARLYQETERRAEEMTALTDIGREISATLDLPTVLERIAGNALKVLDTDTSAVVLLEPDGKTLRPISVIGKNADEIREFTWLMGEGLIGGIAEAGGAERIDDASTDPRAIHITGTDEPAESEKLMVAPLTSRKNVIGVMAVWRGGEGAIFTGAELDFLSGLSKQAEIAIENARLYREAEQSLSELATINVISQGLLSEPNLDSAVEMVGDEVRKIFQADHFEIGLLDKANERIEIPYVFSEGKRLKPQWHNLDKGLFATVIKQGKPALNNSADEVTTNEGIWPAELRESPPDEASFLGVPIFVGKEVIGAIATGRYRDQAFTDSDRDLLVTIAANMGVAIENARLYEETQQRLSELAAINVISQGLLSQLDLDSVVEMVGDEVREIFQADHFEIGLVNKAQGRIEIPYVFSKGKRLERQWHNLDEGLMSIVIENRKLVVLNTTEELYANKAVWPAEIKDNPPPDNSFLGVPVMAGKEVIGVIATGRFRKNAYSESDQNLLTTIAANMGVALQNARLYEETQQRVSELATINIISEGLLSELDQDSVMELVGENLRQMFDGDFYGVALYNRESSLVSIPYFFYQGEAVDTGPPVPLGTGASSYVIQSGEPLLCYTAEEWRQHGGVVISGQGEPDEVSWLGVPIKSGNEVLGSIFSGALRSNAYTESDLRLLATIAANLGIAISNARLLEETRRRADEMGVLAEIGSDIAATLELDPVLERLTTRAGELLNVVGITLFLTDEDGTTLHGTVAVGPYVEQMLQMQVPLGEGIVGAVAQSGVPEVVNKPLDDTRAIVIEGTPAEENAPLMAAPMISRGKVIGVLSAWRHEGADLFTQEDLEFLVSITRQAAIAIESGRLYLETQRRASENAALAEVGREISQTLELETVLESITRSANELLLGDTTGVFLIEPDGVTMQASVAVGDIADQLKTMDITVGKGMIGSIAQSGEAEVINNVATDQRAVHIPGTEESSEGKKLMAAPLISKDKVVGVMGVWRGEQRPVFSEADLDFLVGISRQAAIAIENARLYQESRRRAEEMAVLAEIGNEIATTLELDPVLHDIVRKARELLKVREIALFLLEPDGTTFKPSVSLGYYEEEVMASTITLGKGVSGHIAESGIAEIINYPENDARSQHIPGTPEVEENPECFMSAPLLTRGEVIGLMNVWRERKDGLFSQEDLDFLESLARQAAIAIESARLYMETQRRAEEAAVLAEIGNEIATTLQLEPVIERIGEKARELIQLDQIALLLVDEDDKTLLPVYSHGNNSDEFMAFRQALGQGILGSIAAAGEPEIVPSTLDDDRGVHVPGTPEGENETIMAAPLISRGKVIGLLAAIRWTDEGTFTQKDLDFLVSLARQAAIGIETARLYLETQRRANEMSALAEVGRDVSATLDLPSVLERIATHARDLLAADTSAVYLPTDDEKVLQAIVAVGENADETKASLVNVGEGIIGDLAKRAEAEVINDVDHDPRGEYIPGTPEDTYEKMMVTPLLAGDDVVGMMAVWRVGVGREFSEEDLNFLKGLSRQASIAIQNARLFDEVQRQRDYSGALVENSPVAIVTTDLNAVVVSWNPAAETLFGYTAEEAIGQNVDRLIAKTDGLLEEALSYNEQASHGILHSITQRTRKDGSLVDVDLSGVPVVVDSKPVGLIALYHDITERVRAEEELQRQKEYVEAVLENSPVAIVTVDRDFKVVSWNPTAEKLFGYTQEEAIGENAYELHSTDKEILKESTKYGELIAAGERVQAITQRNTKDGGLVDVEVLGLPVLVDGERVGNVIIYHDITDLLKAQREAEAANQAKSAFLATMSHEIRTPMNAVIGMSGLLLDTPLETDQREYAEIIRNSGDSLLSIINDILDFSKIEAGRMEMEKQAFDLRECMEGALDLIAAKAFEKDLDVAYLFGDNAPAAIVGDVTRLRQILLNLLTNAVKFTEEGEVVLTVDSRLITNGRKKGSLYELQFAVRDTGIGIPTEKIDRLFQSFSQVDASTARRYGGTGLGLAISKRLAELMGGDMWIESEIEKGTTVFFTIQAKSGRKPAARQKKIAASQPLLEGKRVLIVDDNATNRMILKKQTAAWGMNPTETGLPKEALKWIKQGKDFDLAILDMNMPEMDGLSLAEGIRAHRDAKSLPLVLFTSLGRREGGAEEVEFAAQLSKPIKQSQLFDALVAVFDGHDTPVKRTKPDKVSLDPGMAEQHPLRILLAEDNAVNQKLAIRILEQMGYRPDVAGNGLEVVEAIERQKYDVVLMDVQMPEMDGLEATRTIVKRWKGTRRPYIIGLTANAMEGDREACLAAGMNDYITKPIRVPELVGALEGAE